jgi:hypothetical protein
MPKIWVYDIMTIGLVYPLSEHVDIFPVRLVPTFHRVFSVYLILILILCLCQEENAEQTYSGTVENCGRRHSGGQ